MDETRFHLTQEDLGKYMDELAAADANKMDVEGENKYGARLLTDDE